MAPEKDGGEGESGNTLYYSFQYENAKGETGPFSPVQAVVP